MWSLGTLGSTAEEMNIFLILGVLLFFIISFPFYACGIMGDLGGHVEMQGKRTTMSSLPQQKVGSVI